MIETIGVLAILVLLLGSVFGWVSFIKLARLERDISALKKQLSHIQDAPTTKEGQPNEPLPTSLEDMPPEAAMAATPEPVLDATSESTTSSNTRSPWASRGANDPKQATLNPESTTGPDEDGLLYRFIIHFKENWLVWVGALAMVIGGAYLVEVIGSRIELSPEVRVVLAFSLSGVMVAAGEWWHRRESNYAERGFAYAPAALTATGVTGFYGTIVFAYIIYDFFSPVSALAMMAITAICSLALTLRQGPLLAVLGLFGGFTAPLWIGGGTPDYLLLAAYISFISAAGLVLDQQVKRPWLTLCVIVPHVIWMLLLAVDMPKADIFLWSLLFVPLTLYFTLVVPRLGWKVQLGFRHHQTLWSHHPAVFSITASLLILVVSEKLDGSGMRNVLPLYLFVVLLAWLPAIRKGIAPRIYHSATLVASVLVLVVMSLQHVFHYSTEGGPYLFALALSIVLIAARTVTQYIGGDRAPVSRWMLTLTGSLLATVITFYVDRMWGESLTTWSLFVAAFVAGHIVLGLRIHAVSAPLSASVHVMVAMLGVVWLENIMLTTFLSLQCWQWCTSINRNILPRHYGQ